MTRETGSTHMCRARFIYFLYFFANSVALFPDVLSAVRVARIGLAFIAWEAIVLPLNHTRVVPKSDFGIRTNLLSAATTRLSLSVSPWLAALPR